MVKNGLKPLANARLLVEALRPLRGYLLLRLDALESTTRSGLLLPNGTRGAVFADAAIRAQQGFSFDLTAVVVGAGPDEEGFGVGDRVVLPFPPVPVPVIDEDTPLGLIDYKDILCKVEDL